MDRYGHDLTELGEKTADALSWENTGRTDLPEIRASTIKVRQHFVERRAVAARDEARRVQRASGT